MTLNQNSKRNIIHFSAFGITDRNDFGFSPIDYSKFKHGANNIARKFGYTLAERFIEQNFSKTYDGRPIMVVPSAYSHIPTASFFMKKHFVDKLNQYLYTHNYPVVKETKINRVVTYREDYGEMTAEDRFKLICGDKFYIDNQYVKDHVLIFMDDIKITGTHERIIVKMLDESNIHNDCYMLYFAELLNTTIPPNIENYLNNYFIQDIGSINAIINEGEFEFNTRVVKLILNQKKTIFGDFVKNKDQAFINSLYYNAIGNEYYKFEAYIDNLKTLETLVK